jgi:IS30 family transposase
MNYQHFSVEEREKIQELLWQKTSIRDIVRELGRSPSSVSREIRRNKPPELNRYTPRVAHERALLYRRHRGKRKLEINAILREYVVSHLKLGWSPTNCRNSCARRGH